MEERPHTLRLVDSDRLLCLPDNANLRESALRDGWRLYGGPGAFLNCEGRGRCGFCRVRVLEGAGHMSEPTPSERKRLGARLAAGLRLACQCHLRGDAVIDPRG